MPIPSEKTNPFLSLS